MSAGGVDGLQGSAGADDGDGGAWLLAIVLGPTMGSSSASMFGKVTVLSAAPWCLFRRLNSCTDTRRFLPAEARMVTLRLLPLLTYSGCTR